MSVTSTVLCVIIWLLDIIILALSYSEFCKETQHLVVTVEIKNSRAPRKLFQLDIVSIQPRQSGPFAFFLIFGKTWNINKNATFTRNRSIPKVFWKTKSLWSWNDVFLYGNIFIPFRNFCSFRSRRSLYVQSKLISSIAYMFVSLLSFFIFWCIFKEWFKNRILSDKVNRIYTLRNYFLNQLKVENLLLLQENLRS